jgi:hypothetical protein
MTRDLQGVCSKDFRGGVNAHMEFKTAELLTAIFLIIIGLIFFLAGMALKRRGKRLLENCTSSVIGNVKETMQNTNGRRQNPQIAPIFSYIANGREHVKKSKASTSNLNLKAGDSVAVFYNPENPDEYYVKEFKDWVVLDWVFIIIGALVIIIGIVIAFKG